MFRKLAESALKGLTFGAGFSLSVACVVFLFDTYDGYDSAEYSQEQDSRQIKVVKRLIEELPKNHTDSCERLPGVWAGSMKIDDENETYIWETNHSLNGDLTIKGTNKTANTEKTQIGTGTWECENSILVHRFRVDGDYREMTYLIIDINDDERTYVNFSSSGFGEVFRAYRKVK